MIVTELLPTLQQAFPTISSYDTLASIVQANAEGHRLRIIGGHGSEDIEKDIAAVEEDDEDSNIDNDDDNNKCNKKTSNPKEVFMKLVTANKYSHKSWPDFRRTLMYLRTEVRFYKEMLPELQLKGFNSAPEIYLTDYTLDGLLSETELPTDQTTSIPSLFDTGTGCDGKGGYIMMESINDEYYFQDSPLSIDQSKECLSAIAGLHASAWEDITLLNTAERRLSKGSYHLDTRNPKELAEMEQSWEKFCTNFKEQDVTLFERTKDLGTKIFHLAPYISKQLSPKPNDKYATLSHGDYKAMNVFLPKSSSTTDNNNNNNDSNNRGAIIVDFASTGVGLGMSDVAMHIHHAIRPEDLANGGEEELIEHYLTTLESRLSSRSDDDNDNKSFNYPRDVAMRHYRLAVADYGRFILGRFWKSASLETFEKRKTSKNTVLVNRNIDAALAFLDRVDRYVKIIEQEKLDSDKKI